MSIDRLLAYDPEQRKPYRETLTAFYGTEEWLGIVQERLTSAHYHDMYRDLRDLYLSQLRRHWTHADVVMKARAKLRARRLYDMIFAYDHEAAGSIAKYARGQSDQYGFFEGTAS